MKNEVLESGKSNLLPRILTAIVVILATLIMYSILYDIWQGTAISTFKQVLVTLLALVMAVAVITVIVQRIQMRKNENFRREKW